MKLLHSLHECADADGVRARRGRVSAARVAHELLSTIIHGVELSNLVAEADALEEHLNFISGAWQLEIVLANAKLGKGRREQKVHGLGLISVVLLFNRSVRFKH